MRKSSRDKNEKTGRSSSKPNEQVSPLKRTSELKYGAVEKKSKVEKNESSRKLIAQNNGKPVRPPNYEKIIKNDPLIKEMNKDL